MVDQVENCPLSRLAEHLSARPPMPTAGDVAGWLDYSLNRCGLVVVEEQSLTAYNPNERLIAILFDAIQHGDEEYRAWLKELDKHFAAEAVPAPKGKGNSERLREALEAAYREGFLDGVTCENAGRH